MPNKLKNKPGDKIGMLTIIERGPNKNNRVAWFCNCDCGNKNVLISQSVLSKKDRKHPCSCGCENKKQAANLGKKKNESLVGLKFGKLTVIEPTDKRECGAIVYKCKCDCGSLCEVRSTSLRNGHTQSCGCLKSNGELKISQLLSQNNIVYEREKTFPTCIYPDSKRFAKFDFWVDNKYLIEFDGIQHYKPERFSEQITQEKALENLLINKQHDSFKDEWCLSHKIPLIRIPYTYIQDLTIEDLKPETSQWLVI